MTFSLKDVKKGKTDEPQRILVYSPPGVGKSTFGSKFPNHIIMDLDGSQNNIVCTRTPRIKTLAMAHEVIYTLLTKEHTYKTLVIDTIDWLETLMCDEIAEDNGKKDINDIGYYRGYTYLVKKWRKIFRGLDDLRDRKNMTILLLAHAITKTRSPVGEESYDFYAPKLYGKKDTYNSSLEFIGEYCDIIMFANCELITKTLHDGKDKTRNAAIGSRRATLYTSPDNPRHIAKNRCNLEPELPFSFEAFSADFAKKTKDGADSNKVKTKDEEK